MAEMAAYDRLQWGCYRFFDSRARHYHSSHNSGARHLGHADHIRHAGCNGTRKVLPPAPGYMTARLSALRTDKMKTCASRASKVRRTRPDSVRLRAIGIASSVFPPLSTVPRHRERLSSWQSVAALARGSRM